MFAAIILICASAIARPDCQENTAIDYRQVPGAYDLPLACLREGQEFAADLLRRGVIVVGQDRYIKVRCSHSEFGSPRA